MYRLKTAELYSNLNKQFYCQVQTNHYPSFVGVYGCWAKQVWVYLHYTTATNTAHTIWIWWKLLQNDCNSTFVWNASLCCIIVVLSILCFSQFKWNVCWSGPSLLWVDIRFSYTFFRANEPSDRSVLIILKVIQWWAVTLLVVPFTFFSVSLGS